MPVTHKSRLSLSALRNLILVALALGIIAYAVGMFAIVQRLSQRYGPEMRADLEWRVLRGAQELSRAADVGLVVGDAVVLRRAFEAYIASPDVQAIVAVDAAEKVILMHGQPPEQVGQLFGGPEQALRSEPGYLVSWSHSTIEGAHVGRVAVVVSTHRLSQTMALLEQESDMTLLGGFTALVLGILVVTFYTRAVALRDAQLSDHAANLERRVDERTRELDERNRGLRLVLDNVAQGFITIELDGRMARERSAIIDRWFGEPEDDVSFARHLEPHAPAFAASFALNLEQLRDGFLPPELVLEQMPRRFSAVGKSFDVVVSPVRGSTEVERLLVIVSDVTEHLARERAEREQKELMAIFQRILIDRGSVEEFLTEAQRLVEGLITERDPIVQRRLVHTLKGNSAMYGLGSLAELAHAVETTLIDENMPLDDEQRRLLTSSWRDAMARVEGLLGGPRKDRVELERVELDALLDRVREGLSRTAIVAWLEDWEREPVERRLEHLGRQAVGLARRLGKPEPEIEIVSNGIRLDAPTWAAYWTAMVHAVRNAVDHGLEEPSVRIAAGKPARGRIVLGVAREQGQLSVTLEDDGGGVDWERVRGKAAAAGLACVSHEELVEALFTDGITTRDHVNEVSGRGVGLAALRQTVSEMGGRARVDSAAGRGTRLCFTFDEAALSQARPASAPVESAKTLEKPKKLPARRAI